MPNFRPMVRTGADPEWYGNALVFATEKEAQWSANELASRWMLVVETRTDETDAPVNYRIDFDTGTMHAIEKEAA